jgi:hypothetical protein
MATTTFNDLITFSRGSNATVTGPNGLIQWAPSNVLTFSEQFDNAVWSPQSLTVSTNVAMAPDGTTTADLAYPTSSGSQRRFARGSLPSASDIYTNSIYLKANGLRWVYMFDNAGISVAAWFDVLNGVVGTVVAGFTATITSVGNGWYRCSLTNTTPAAPSFRGYIGLSDANNSEAVTTSGTNGVFFWGAQLELGSTATTYNNTSVRNLVGFSEAFDNAAWVKTRCSMVTGAQANPVNGLFNAQKLMEDTTTGARSIVLGGGTVGGLETISIYAKPAGRSWLVFQIGTNSSAYFDLANGALGTLTNATASIVAVGSGWYRCSMTATRAGTTNNFVFTASANGVTSYTGDGNSGVYIYGAQLSNSASLDPYVPTPGAAPSSTAYYGPRFDYDPVTLSPRGLLIEEQRTNLALYSERFDDAAWTKQNVGAISAGTFTAPDGTATAERMVATAGINPHLVYTTTAPTTATGVNHAWTVYVKKDAYRFVYLNQNVGTNNNITAVFDLDGTGSTATQTGVGSASGTIASTSIQNVGNGWFRISLVGAVTGASRFCAVGFAAAATGNTINVDGNVTFTAAGTEAVLLWGAQLEAGAFATSYIPTIASTVTRSADVATITGSLFSQWYNQPAGAIVVDGDGQITGQSFYYTLNDSTGNNRISSLQFLTTARGWAFTAGVSQAQMDASGTLVANTAYKTGLAYATDNYAYVRDGGTVVTDTSGSVPITDRLLIGVGPGSAGYLNGHIRSIRYVPVRAADFQLQALTAPPELLSLNIYDRFNDLVLDRAGQTIEVR